MIIEQTFTVSASPERTAEFFCDIDQVSSCIPGVEGVRELDSGKYAATLAVRLGPIKAGFQGSIALDESEAPSRLKASGEGRDKATGSMVKVDFIADLTEDEPGETTVRAAADLTIRGKLSQFGTGVMRAAAGEIVQEFAACANAKLAMQSLPGESVDLAAAPGTAPLGASGEHSPESTGRRQRGIFSIVARGLLRSFARGLRRTADRIEGRLDGAVNRG